MTGEAVVARAREALGARFRWHGRWPASGLDCVGLVSFACGLGVVPTGYRPRGSAEAAERLLVEAGLVAVEAPEPGDVLLCQTGPGQVHLAIVSAGGLIHADARAGRVVERPGMAPWPVLSAWRAERG